MKGKRSLIGSAFILAVSIFSVAAFPVMGEEPSPKEIAALDDLERMMDEVGAVWARISEGDEAIEEKIQNLKRKKLTDEQILAETAADEKAQDELVTKAEAVYRAYIEKHPYAAAGIIARLEYADNLIAEERFQKAARTYLQEVIDMSKASAFADQAAIMLANNEEDPDAAIDAFRKIQYESTSPVTQQTASLDLIEVFIEIGRYDEGLSEINGLYALEAPAIDISDAYLSNLMILLLREDLPAAQTLVKQVNKASFIINKDVRQQMNDALKAYIEAHQEDETETE